MTQYLTSFINLSLEECINNAVVNHILTTDKTEDILLISQSESPMAIIDKLHETAKNDQDSVTSLYLKINNKEFKDEDLRKYRTHTKEIEVVFPDNALFGIPSRPSLAVLEDIM
jgi:hypothetical protein